MLCDPASRDGAVLLDHECRIPTAHALESHTTRQRSLQRHRDDSVPRLVPECAPCGATFDDSGVRRAGPASSWRYPAALRTCFLSRGDILNATDRKYSTIWRRTALRRARWAVVKLILRSGAGPVGRKKWTSTASAHSCIPPAHAYGTSRATRQLDRLAVKYIPECI